MITLAEGVAGSAPVLLLSASAAAGVWLPLRRRLTVDRPQLAGFAAVFISAIAWLLWIARPSLMPQGGAPDLTHHLLLIEYIERHWQLIHDGRLGGYLGEMIAYTPGSHLLIALAGAWSGTSGFRAAYPVVAMTVAFKCAIVFLIAGRLLPTGPSRTPLAFAAAALVFLPRVYMLGSFLERSFFAQVVSELFAVGAWGVMIAWNDRTALPVTATFGVVAAAVFLSWPVWAGPVVLVFVLSVAAHHELALRERLLHAAAGLGPPALVALLHASRHLDAVVIATVPGYVVHPSPALFGWPFLALAAIGLVAAVIRPRTRTIVWFVVAIAAQSATLYWMAHTRESPYLAFKMMYLAIYPLAIAGAIGIAAVIRWRSVAWAVAAVIAIMAARSAVTMPRPKPIVSVELSDAGTWARANVPPACVDYLVTDSDTGYWLHLARLGNARTARRTIDPETFVPAKAIERWILPGGVPYAIAEDFSALPRDIRESVDVLARFGPAAVVKRRGPATCPP